MVVALVANAALLTATALRVGTSFDLDVPNRNDKIKTKLPIWLPIAARTNAAKRGVGSKEEAINRCLPMRGVAQPRT